MSPIRKLTSSIGLGLLCAALGSPHLSAAEKRKATTTSSEAAEIREAIQFERHKLAAAAAEERKEQSAAGRTSARKHSKRPAVTVTGPDRAKQTGKSKY